MITKVKYEENGEIAEVFNFSMKLLDALIEGDCIDLYSFKVLYGSTTPIIVPGILSDKPFLITDPTWFDFANYKQLILHNKEMRDAKEGKANDHSSSGD